MDLYAKIVKQLMKEIKDYLNEFFTEHCMKCKPDMGQDTQLT